MKDWIEKHIWSSDDKGGGVKKAPPQTGTHMGVGSPNNPQMMAPSMQTSSTPTAPFIPMGVDQAMLTDIQKIISRQSTAFRNLEENANTFLEVLPNDEIKRIQAAFALLKKQGVNAAQVVSSIDLHVRDINNELETFNAQATTAINRKAGNLRNEAEQLIAANQADEQRVQDLHRQIAETQQRISERTTQIGQKQNEAATAESEIRSQVEKFRAAAEYVIANLNMKKTHLSSMLN
jgi:predicted  nucleic acid-binding Zn-ribbon protein